MHILCSSRLRRRARARDSVRVPYASHHKHQHPCHHSSQAPGRRPLTGRRSTARRGCCTAVSQPSTALRWTSCAHLGAAADELPLVPADGGRGRGGRGGGGRGREAEGAQDGREAALPPQMLRRGGGGRAGGVAGIFKVGGSEYPRLPDSRVLLRVRRELFETGKASSGVGWLSNGCSSTPSFPDAGQTVAAAFVIISQIAGCKECQAYILLLLWIGRTNRLVGADGTKSEGRGP